MNEEIWIPKFSEWWFLAGAPFHRLWKTRKYSKILELAKHLPRTAFRKGFELGVETGTSNEKSGLIQDLTTVLTKRNAELKLVQEVIKNHGCSSPKDCGLHFLDEQLKAKFPNSKLVREDSETFVVK